MLAVDLSGKNALVLGGSRGIGAGITKALALAGAYVVFTHTGNPEHAGRAAELIASVEAAGGKAKAVASDVLDSSALNRLAAELALEAGTIDILVCNVGKNIARPLSELSDDSWKEFLDINLTSAFYGVRAVMPYMEKTGYGKIILIGSSAVFDGGGGTADYAAAKAGMTGLMAYLNRAYLKKGIRTNIIHPCVIETDLLKNRYSKEEDRRKLIAQIPVGRLGKPEDIAGLAAFLASSWGDYITGQEILCDGGRTLFNK